MDYMTAILLSLSSNLDTFAVCLTYGIKKVKLSITSSLLISFITSLGTFLSMILGKIMTSFISPKIVTSIGATLLIILGISMICNFIKKFRINHLKNLNRYEKVTYSEILIYPEKADIDNSGDLDLKECLTLSIALTLNNLSLGVVASIAGINILLNTIFTFIITLMCIALGFYLGGKYASKLSGEYSDLISGLLLVLIGIYQILI